MTNTVHAGKLLYINYVVDFSNRRGGGGTQKETGTFLPDIFLI